MDLLLAHDFAIILYIGHLGSIGLHFFIKCWKFLLGSPPVLPEKCLSIEKLSSSQKEVQVFPNTDF